MGTRASARWKAARNAVSHRLRTHCCGVRKCAISRSGLNSGNRLPNPIRRRSPKDELRAKRCTGEAFRATEHKQPEVADSPKLRRPHLSRAKSDTLIFAESVEPLPWGSRSRA